MEQQTECSLDISFLVQGVIPLFKFFSVVRLPKNSEIFQFFWNLYFVSKTAIYWICIAEQHLRRSWCVMLQWLGCLTDDHSARADAATSGYPYLHNFCDYVRCCCSILWKHHYLLIVTTRGGWWPHFPLYLHLATSEIWCWSGGRDILRTLSLCYSIVYYYNCAQG